MRRSDLEHLIRAAAAITNDYEIMVIGSQSILGAVPNAPDSLLQSMDADLYPMHFPELSDLIDGALGELSPFEDRFGYYAQGVGPETAILPHGWDSRLVKIQNANTDLRIGYCLEPHDLAVSKLAAGRDKDWPFVTTMLLHNIIDADTVLARIQTLPILANRKEHLTDWVTQRTRDIQAVVRSRAERIAELPRLAQSAGAEYTLWCEATKLMQTLPVVTHTDWGPVEKNVVQISIAECGQSPEDVADALCKHSPGAVLMDEQQAIRKHIALVAPSLQAGYQVKRLDASLVQSDDGCSHPR